MKSHKFVLVLSGVAEITPELADALFDSTKSDIELSERNGIVFLECERSAPTLQDAITDTIREVEQADVSASVARVVRELPGWE